MNLREKEIATTISRSLLQNAAMFYSISKSLELCLAVTLCLSVPVLVEPSRVKIHTSQPSDGKGERALRQTSATACEDKQEVNRSSLNLTGQLSMLSERVRFFRSNYATQSIRTILSSELVVGLDMVSVSTVLGTLQREGCPSYIFGGMVRDQFLGIPSNDIDVDVGCSLETLLAVCRRKWGAEVCSSNAKHTIAHIGTPYHPLALDLASAEEDFYGPLTNLEYTANSLAYDLNGHNVVLDVTGSGVEDVCARKIHIPSDNGSRSSWEAWSTPTRLYRYWKLRFKGFTALDSATSDFITTEVKGLIEADTPRGLSLKKFYCKKVFSDSHYRPTDNTCHGASLEMYKMERERASRYNRLLAEDLGEEYVHTLALPTCSSHHSSTALTITQATIIRPITQATTTPSVTQATQTTSPQATSQEIIGATAQATSSIPPATTQETIRDSTPHATQSITQAIIVTAGKSQATTQASSSHAVSTRTALLHIGHILPALLALAPHLV